MARNNKSKRYHTFTRSLNKYGFKAVNLHRLDRRLEYVHTCEKVLKNNAALWVRCCVSVRARARGRVPFTPRACRTHPSSFPLLARPST
jgi:hypothetical protein